MAFMGELSDVGVADLLQLLGLRRQTGRLTISSNGDDISLYLERGQLVLVSSSNLALRLGRILVDRGWLSETDLILSVEEQCVQALTHVITADQGVFVWSRDVTAPRRVEAVPLFAERILLEAVRRTDELASLKEQLPPF